MSVARRDAKPVEKPDPDCNSDAESDCDSNAERVCDMPQLPAADYGDENFLRLRI
jgi:hypothetical protein